MRQKSIFQLIHLAEQMNNEHIVRFTSEYAYPIGVSPILVLSELNTRGARKQVELAELLGFTKGAMTNISNKLVDLGLAKRLYDDKDRRTIQLQITPEGQSALKQAQAIGDKLFTELFSVFTDGELAQYFQLQEKLAASIEKKK